MEVGDGLRGGGVENGIEGQESEGKKQKDQGWN